MAAVGSAAEAMQPAVVGEAGQDGEVKRAGAGAGALSPVHHMAREAEGLRALGGVLGEELQLKELLLEAVEAPWKEVSGEESSDEDVEVGSPLYPGGLAPKRMRDETIGQDGRSKQHVQPRGGSRG